MLALQAASRKSGETAPPTRGACGNSGNSTIGNPHRIHPELMPAVPSPGIAGYTNRQPLRKEDGETGAVCAHRAKTGVRLAIPYGVPRH